MRGIVSAQVSAGARTCVLVGSLDAVEEFDLSAYRSLLWFAREGARMPGRFRLAPDTVVAEPVERTDRARVGGALDRLIQRDALHLPSVFLTEEAVGESAGQFLPVIETILARCESHLRARLTRQQVGFSWQNHLLTNLPAYARARLPRAWAGALEGIPALVCGSGPSLDASGGRLAEFAGRGVVLAADSALTALARLGIGVDFAVTIDATKTPENCLRSSPPPGRLLLASVSPPAWQRTMPAARTYFLSGNQITEQWLAEHGAPKTDLAVQGNCGITAVELAVYLGCHPICLFGMDNAVDGQGSGRLHQQHFDPAHLGDERPVFGGNYPKVPGNYQEEIATPFLREWRLLDERCAGLAPGRVINVIDRGARLRNTTLVHPADFSLADGGACHAGHLARLAPAESIGEGEWRRLVSAVHAAAGGAAPIVDETGRELARGDRARAVRLLAQAFTHPGFSSLMGNYGLKVMPHLLQPDEGAPEFWDTVIAECRHLITLANQMG